VKVEITGKEIVCIVLLICSSILLGLGYNDVLRNILCAVVVAYLGVDRYLLYVKRKKGK